MNIAAPSGQDQLQDGRGAVTAVGGNQGRDGHEDQVGMAAVTSRVRHQPQGSGTTIAVGGIQIEREELERLSDTTPVGRHRAQGGNTAPVVGGSRSHEEQESMKAATPDIQDRPQGSSAATIGRTQRREEREEGEGANITTSGGRDLLHDSLTASSVEETQRQKDHEEQERRNTIIPDSQDQPRGSSKIQRPEGRSKGRERADTTTQTNHKVAVGPNAKKPAVNTAKGGT